MSSGMADAAGRGKSAIVAVAERLPRINALSIEAFQAADGKGAGRVGPAYSFAGDVAPACSFAACARPIRPANGVGRAHVPGEPEWALPAPPNAGRGRGQVRARRESDAVVTFEESGAFELQHGPTLNFHNALRWTIESDRIVLAHCRHNVGDGTRLVELRAPPTPSTDADLASAAPHLCGQDHYTATLRLVDGGFNLVWQITGPRKRQRLIHRYRRVTSVRLIIE